MGDSVKNKKRGKISHFPVDENGRCSDEEPTHKKSKKKQKLNSNLIDENLDPSNTDSMSLNNSEEPGESLQKAETELTPKTKSKKKKKKNNKAEAENLEGSDEEFEESFKKAETELTPKTKSKKKKKKNKAEVENMEGSDEEPEESLQKAETELTPKSKSKKKKKKKNKADAENIEESNDSVVSKTNGDVMENDSSSDESDISDGESANSVSSFNIDSYPSDDDDDEVEEENDSSEDEEAQKKRGLPIGAVPSAELEEKENRTIFVGNLPKTVDRHKLQKWFSRFGKVECVRLRSAPIADLEMPKKVAVIKKSFHENRSNISAYIRYKDIEGAQNALQANCTKYGEFTLRVDNARHKGGYDGKKAVFVGNVPFTIEENSLINLFSKCGDVESVRIIRDKQTGVGKGFGYVNFKCSSSIPLALKLDGEVLEKRELRVKPVKYNKKNSYKAQSNISQKRNNFKFKSGSKQVKSNGFREMKKHGSSGKPPFKKSKFQGELSKRKEKSKFKKKSFATKKREIYSKILANKKKTD